MTATPSLLKQLSDLSGYIIFEFDHYKKEPVIKRPIWVEFSSSNGTTIRLLAGRCDVKYVKTKLLKGELSLFELLPVEYPSYSQLKDLIENLPEYESETPLEQVLRRLRVTHIQLEAYTDDTLTRPIELTPVWFSINGVPMNY